MGELAPTILLDIIQHNVETKPKPFHHNKDLMKAVLQMETSR
jgi:hypothetical protein